MALKENYKDDILDVSVNTKRKYRMTDNGDGTVSLDDETVYTQEGDSFGASDMNATNGKVNALETDIGEINDNLSGFKYYPIGTQLVALVADDSFYTDANGKYILASSTTGQSMIDNVTYKALASTEETHGEVGADSAVPFKGGLDYSDIKSQGNVIVPSRLMYNNGIVNTCYLVTPTEYVFFKVWNEGAVNVSVSSTDATVTLVSSDVFQYSQVKGYLYKISGKIGDKFSVSISGGGHSSGFRIAVYDTELEYVGKYSVYNDYIRSIPISSNGEYFLVYGTGDGGSAGSMTLNEGIELDRFTYNNGVYGAQYIGNKSADSSISLALLRGGCYLLKKK